MCKIVVSWEIDPSEKNHRMPFNAIKRGSGCTTDGKQYHKMYAEIEAYNCIEAEKILLEHQPTAQVMECDVRL